MANPRMGWVGRHRPVAADGVFQLRSGSRGQRQEQGQELQGGERQQHLVGELGRRPHRERRVVLFAPSRAARTSTRAPLALDRAGRPRSSPLPSASGQNGPDGAASDSFLRLRSSVTVGSVGDFERKANNRVAWLGFMDPHLHLLARDSPVISRVSIMRVFQTMTSLRMRLWGADMKCAYVQGKDDSRPENIYMRPPRDPVAIRAVPNGKTRTVSTRFAPGFTAASIYRASGSSR